MASDLRNQLVRLARDDCGECEEIYRLLADESPLGICIINVDGAYQYVNARFTEMLGYTLADIPDGRTWFAKAYPDAEYRKEVVSTWISDLEKSEAGKSRPRTFTVRCKDGSEKVVHFRPVTLSMGGQFIVLEDATERHRAEEALRRERDFATTLVEQSPAFFVAIAADGKVRMMNRAMLEATGYRENEIFGEEYVPVLVPECERDAVDRVFAELAAGTLTQSENHVRAKDGRELLVEWRGVPFFGSDGSLDFFFSIGIDVTERRRAEGDLQRSENLYRAIFEAAADGMFLMDKDRFVDCNPRAQELFGRSREELVGMSPVEVSPERQPDGGSSWESALVRIGEAVAGHPQFFEWQHLHKDGTLFDVEVTLNRVDVSGKQLIMAFVRDITERKRAELARKELEKQLRQAQKMEALGTLAGGIAHDFNNMLQAIGGYTDMLRRGYTDSPKAQLCVDRIRAASSRAAELVAQILTFSRHGEQVRRPADLTPAVKEALKLLRGSLPATIEMKTEIQARCPRVVADPTEIHQVVMNLCTNAYHAMRDTGGVLTVRLDTVELSAAASSALFGSRPGPHLRLTVTDTGPGIPKSIQERVLEPFFTTKEAGDGTGLGLATVHGIVTGLGGALSLESETGKGACFTVLLPVNASTECEMLAATTAPEDVGGHEHVLFVDDEVALVELVDSVLSDLGYQVSGFSSPLEAFAAFQEKPDAYDILVADVVMPQMTGMELVRLARGTRPDLPVVLWSGFSEKVDENAALEAGASAYLRKPVDPDVLADAVRRALDSRVPSPVL